MTKFAAKNKKLLKNKITELVILKAQHSDLKTVGKTVMAKKNTIISKTKTKLLTNPDDLDEGDSDDNSDDEEEDIFMKVNPKVPAILSDLNTNVYIRLHAERLVEIIQTWTTERYSSSHLSKWQKKMETYYRDDKIGNKLILAFTIKQMAEDNTLMKIK